MNSKKAWDMTVLEMRTELADEIQAMKDGSEYFTKYEAAMHGKYYYLARLIEMKEWQDREGKVSRD